MSLEIKVPVLPESVADATIATWHKKPGEPVKRDEHLVDIETDKVMLEVVAPADGTLEKIIKDQGSVVKAAEVIATFSEGAVAAPAEAKPAEAKPAEAKPAEAKPAEAKPAEAKPAEAKPAEEKPAEAKPAEAKPAEEKPAEAKPAEEKPAESKPAAASTPPPAAPNAPAAVQPTPAPSGSMLSPSARRALSEQPFNAAPVSANPPVAAQAMQGPAQIRFNPANNRIEKRVPMTRLRAKIAERLLAAQQNAAILTTFNEINMGPVIMLRNTYKEEFMHKYGVKLGFMSFFVTAVVAALKQFPTVNASIDGNDIVYHGYFDIGIAVSTERGLVVPIVRDADSLTMAEIEKQISQFSQSARDGKLTMEEITGGTFTITNGGVFGSLMATPILNPPQSAILGMHKIEERPIVENKQIVIRPMMYVALSYDHRIIDGAESVQFLVAVKELLEDPARLLLSV